MSERAMYWRGVLARQVRSGSSVAEFCGAEGIATASFYVWRKRLRPGPGQDQRREGDAQRREVRAPQPTLVPVSVAAAQACVEVVLPCGTLLRVPEGTTPETLRDVLAALEAAAC